MLLSMFLLLLLPVVLLHVAVQVEEVPAQQQEKEARGLVQRLLGDRWTTPGGGLVSVVGGGDKWVKSKTVRWTPPRLFSG